MLQSTLLASLALAVSAFPVGIQQQPLGFESSRVWKWYPLLPEVETEALQDLVTEEGLRERAEALYNVSQKSVPEYGHPTRVIGSEGHWATINYITTELRKLGGYYNVETQNLTAVFGKVNSFSLLVDGVEPKSLAPIALTPPTPRGKPVHGSLVVAANFGCGLDDYPDTVGGNIVLVKRGVCLFGDKSNNAGKAGAVGVIVYDPENDGDLHATLGEIRGNEVATLSILRADADLVLHQLHKNPKLEITLYVDLFVKNITTLNVIAETTHGDHDNVVSLGAHSDSVAAGPGINDDGSGTISLLEVAKHLSGFKIKNAVRFAWWAAEEEGLIGSTHYAQSLSPEENAKVRFFLDYDMMASPNYEYQVYDANNKDHPNGLGDLKDFFIDWYTEHGYNHTLVPFDGRSDYVGFIDAGIPAGGIATGAEGIKTNKGKEAFGGKVGHQFDDCYHLACDDLLNPNYDAWVANTKLIAHSVGYFARSFEGFPVRESQAKALSSAFKYRGSKLII